VFVPDVNVDPEFQPYRALAARVPFRAVLSCPLFGKDGKLIGIMSAISWTHFEPTALELDAAQAYCKALSAAIVAFAPAEGLAQWAERKSAAVLKAAGTSSLLPASSSAR
jgi:GAF domain-containing protein